MIGETPNNLCSRVFFDKFDRVTINDMSCNVVAGNSEGYLLNPERENSLTQLFTHADLRAYSQAGCIRVEQSFFAPEGAKKSREEADFDLNLCDAALRRQIAIRWSYCKAVEELREKGVVKLSYGPLGRAMDTIRVLAERYFREFTGVENEDRKHYGGGTREGLDPICASTLGNWYRRFKKHGVYGLIDQRKKSGRRGTRLCAEAELILQRGAALYLQPDEPTKTGVFKNTQRLFELENLKRVKLGTPALPVPAKNTILKRINSFTPYEVTLNRKGREAARAKFFPVGKGLQTSRPLERVEMDGWKVDLLTLAKTSGILHNLSPELVQEMELDGGKKRWHLFAAICCKTRCILSLTLSRNEGSAAAVDAMQMMLLDKGKIADAVGALSPWNMQGTPDLLVTDNGAAFKNHRFIGAASSISLNTMRAPAGLPQLRGTIERLFGTVATNLVSRLSGRTFSDVVEKGEHPTEMRAVLTVQDFADMLVRWVVDVYHNQPHEGLGGETPLECWSRLANIYGVRPAPDRRSQRVAFGVAMTRSLSNVGVEVLGVRYNNERLMQHLRHSNIRELELRWLSQNIGEIEVNLEGEWLTVGSVLPEFRGRSARDWISARRLIRNGDPNARKVSEDRISQALSEIDRLNRAAGERAGILSERWDSDMVRRFEENTLIGFKVGQETPHPVTSSKYGTKVDAPQQATSATRPTSREPVSDSEEPPAKSQWRFKL